MYRNKTREFVMAGLLLAIGIAAPSILHFGGISGKVLLPMHIPPLIAGYVISPSLAGFIGFMLPYLNCAVTGMPVIFPMAVIMSVELGLYGFSTAILSQKFKINNVYSLLLGMIIGRIGAGLSVYMLIVFFGLKMNAILFVKGAIITGLPGILIQIILIPVIVDGIKRYNSSKMANGRL